MNAGRYCLSLLTAALLAATAAAQSPEQEPSLFAAGRATDDAPGWFVGVGFSLVQPYFQHNPAFTLFSQQQVDPTLDPRNPNTQTVREAARTVEVNHNVVVSPHAWIGYMNDEGFGFRASGWTLEAGTSQTAYLPPFAGQFRIGGRPGQQVIVVNGNQVTVASAAPLGLQAFGDTIGIQHGAEAVAFNVTTKLSVQVGDLEAVQAFRYNNWSLLLTGGLRYVQLDQTYNAYDAQSGSPLAFRTLASSYDFHGLGPTLNLEGRVPVGGGFAVYGQGRGSIVFGTADQNAIFFGRELRNNDPNPQFASEHHNRAIPILDFETGLEYGCQVGRGRVFGQIGFMGQQWFNAGSASRSTTLHPAGTLRPVLGGAPLDSNLAFLGFTFRVGFNY